MAITSYEKDGTIFYRVYVQERSRKDKTVRVQRSKAGLNSLAEARREEKKLTRQVFERVAEIEAKGITWRELIHRWEICAKNGLAGKRYTHSSVIDHVNALLKHTDSWLEKRVLSLGRSDGRHIINTLLQDNYSVSRIKTIKGSINKVWTWGVEENLIHGNLRSPVHGVEFNTEKNQYKPILTLDEVKLLLSKAEEVKHPWRHVWAVAILTGMRSGELFALTWEDVDFDNDIIRITKSYSHRIRGIKSTKNTEWRNAHISADLRSILDDLKGAAVNDNFVLQRAPGWSCGNAGKVLRIFLKKIGVDKYVTFHTLRACFATHVLASGAEPTQVMKMGGWADFKTFQIYIRMAGVDVKGVTDKFRII